MCFEDIEHFPDESFGCPTGQCDPSADFGHTRQLGGDDGGSRSEHHPEHAYDKIELAVNEGQRFGVAFLEVDAQTVRGRERVFQYYAERCGTRSVLLRLNYAVEMRYGVLVDIGRKVFEQRPVDVTMGHVNVIWQGDANSVALRSFGLCAVPPAVLNVAGPETLEVGWIAGRFGKLFGIAPRLEGTEAESALLNDAGRCHSLFGPLEVTLEQAIEWTAEWIRAGGASLNKPTHFEARDGRF